MSTSARAGETPPTPVPWPHDRELDCDAQHQQLSDSYPIFVLTFLSLCSIRFSVARGKEGIIDFIRGSELKVAKGKRGHLLVVSRHMCLMSCMQPAASDCVPLCLPSRLLLRSAAPEGTAAGHSVIPVSWAGGLRLGSFFSSFSGCRMIPQAHTQARKHIYTRARTHTTHTAYSIKAWSHFDSSYHSHNKSFFGTARI